MLRIIYVDDAVCDAEEAIEKWTPKKVLLDNYEGHMGKKCPCCSTQVWLDELYCHKCGQHLQWK